MAAKRLKAAKWFDADATHAYCDSCGCMKKARIRGGRPVARLAVIKGIREYCSPKCAAKVGR